MDIQKLNKVNNKTKIWLISLLKILIKKGNYIKYFKIINIILKNIILNYKDLDEFFYKIDKNLCLPINIMKKKIAGKNVIIPMRVSKNKEIIFSAKIIIKSLKFRNEKTLSEKLYYELIDIYNNKGVSVKKK